MTSMKILVVLLIIFVSEAMSITVKPKAASTEQSQDDVMYSQSLEQDDGTCRGMCRTPEFCEAKKNGEVADDTCHFLPHLCTEPKVCKPNKEVCC